MHPTTKLLVLFFVAAVAVFSSSTHALLAPPPRMLAGNGTGAACCVPHEREALLEFKKGITSDPTGQLASWRRDGELDCCRWRGVRCSKRTGVVRELHLRNVHANNTFLIDDRETALVGQISPSLLSLRHLVHLDLSVQELQGPTGRVPEFLGSFRKLRYLNLSCVPFSGRVPPQLGNLSMLQHLDLSQSNFVFLSYSGAHLSSPDISWLTRLPMLQYLNMQYVNLSMAADWAHAVNTLPSLRTLCLSQCSLQSANQSLPHLNLTNLQDLDLSGNNFPQPAASCWFWNITGLRHLNVHYSYLYGQPPNALGDLKYLQVLVLSSNSISSMAPSMRNLCSLEILDLSDNFLHDNIFEMLPQCSPNKLTEVHLGNNNITCLPKLIGEFVSIVSLDLSNNLLTGPIPSEIARLNKLAYLDLSNKLSHRGHVLSTFTFGTSSKLANLDLSNKLALTPNNNQLTGPIPSEIGRLNNLAYLDLSGNIIGGVVTEDHFANLSNLKEIYLSGNSLKVVVDPEWRPPFSLAAASFASCQIGPLFPPWLEWQVHLSYLDISSAGIADRLPDWFCTTFANVTEMVVSENGINGSLPTNMKVMASLRRLYLDSNQLTGQIPQLPVALDILDMSRNSLSGPLPSNFGAPYIQELKLYSNLLTGHIPESICELQAQGMILDVSNNHLEGGFPPCFQPTYAWILVFRNNRFTGNFPSFLQNCNNLFMLDLSRNHFSGRLPLWIGELVSLEVLRLSHNMFSHSIPTTITNLRKLIHLNLANNSMSGVIPHNLSGLMGMKMGNSPTSFTPNTLNLSVLTKGQELDYKDDRIFEMVIIDLSSNFLTNGVPEEVVTLDGVLSLNLSWNNLSGKLPYKIGAMQSLESLDLSRNRFQGEIPQSLSNLSYLSYLDLSYNNLTGSIPSGGQLDTLYDEYPAMYYGNIAICGHPLPNNCPGNKAPMHRVQDQKAGGDTMFFYLGLAAGFVAGLWVVFCTMLFKKAWRIAYFRLFDRVYDKVYVFVAVSWARFIQKTSMH